MSKKAVEYKVGDSVFYPAAGVGVIEAMEDIYIGGQCDTCYVIRIRDNQMTVKVPRASLAKTGIRPLVDGKRIKELHKILGSKSANRVTGGNWTERCKDLERKINLGTCLDLGAVVRDLMRWKSQSGLSFEEAMLLETARSHLVNELALAQGIPRETAFDQIRSSVGVAA